MSSQTTLGWSLITSGIVTIVIGFLPGPDLFWGALLLVSGLLVYLRQ